MFLVLVKPFGGLWYLFFGGPWLNLFLVLFTLSGLVVVIIFACYYSYCQICENIIIIALE